MGTRRSSSSNSEVTVAIIGALGVVIAACISGYFGYIAASRQSREDEQQLKETIAALEVKVVQQALTKTSLSSIVRIDETATIEKMVVNSPTDGLLKATIELPITTFEPLPTEVIPIQPTLTVAPPTLEPTPVPPTLTPTPLPPTPTTLQDVVLENGQTLEYRGWSLTVSNFTYKTMRKTQFALQNNTGRLVVVPGTFQARVVSNTNALEAVICFRSQPLGVFPQSEREIGSGETVEWSVDFSDMNAFSDCFGPTFNSDTRSLFLIIDDLGGIFKDVRWKTELPRP